GPKTHKCIGGELETRDAQIPSFIRRVCYHFGGHVFIVGVTRRRVGSKWLGYEKNLRSWLRIRLKSKENDALGRTSFRPSGLGVHRVGDIVPGDVSSGVTSENQNWWLPFTTTVMGPTPYKDLTIRAVISEEFFVVVYATVEMQETDKNNRYDFLPTHEPIIISELACNPEYMPWFRIHNKPYLYREEARCRHLHMSRPQRVPLNSMSGKANPLSTSMQELAPTALTPMPTPPPVQYVPSYSSAYPNPFIFTQVQYIAPHFSTSNPMSGWTVGHPSPMWHTPEPSHFLMMLMLMIMYRPSMHEAPTESPLVIPLVYGTQHSCAHSSFVTQTPPGSLFYQCESSFQTPIYRPEDA
ncbi:hypothetical protein Gohar_000479, partial [Gossypium harknessii]|nr:hypothetical protein [Gossypium harknessii]